jgi:glucose/mannose-6-phosphate isomerase
MMDDMIARFPAQLREALDIGMKANIKPLEQPVKHFYVAGLGGSGIGANFVAEFVRDELQIPYLVGKGYYVPGYVGPDTLAVASSYSGNTEETLMSYDQMKASGARIVVIASGGKLAEKARNDGFDVMQVPDNWSSPRACLGYSLVQQLCLLHHLGLIEKTTIEQIATAADLLEKDSNEIKAKASRIAELLHGKIPVIYTTDRMESVAIRFRQQINENAKMLCWHHVVPEMNHNELVGWRDKNDQLAVVYFRNRDDFDRNAMRIDINKEIIGHYTSTIIDLYSKGNSLVERAMYFVHLGDWVSWYLAGLRGVDAVEVKVIDYLKSELANN